MSSAGHAPKDLWGAAAADDVEALRSLVGQGGGELDKDSLDLNVDERDDHGRTALQAAASAGAETAVRFLLARGANPNKADWESHWTALHRALYHGHLRIALLLLRAGAVLGDELTPWHGAGHVRGSNNDKKGSNGSRKDGVDKDGLTPLSLLSWRLRAHLQQAVREGRGGDVVTFGKTDFPLGYALPNTRDVQKPRRVEALADIEVVTVAAAKHQSVVLDVQGRVFTWGHGRGGRLGHGDEHPQMFPRLVSALVGLRVVKVAAAENHTVCVTDQGLVFSWGSDRFGQLGLGNGAGSSSAAAATGGQGQGQGSTRLVPRRIEALRRCLVADVSAGATHTVAVTREGEVYTWGGNKSGQLGYEGVGAAGDGMPRMVSLLYHRANGKDPRRAIQVSAGCRCTLVVVEGGAGAQGPNKVYQFGYGSHVPLRVDFRPAEKAQREVGKRRSNSFSGSSSSSSKSNSWAAQDGTRGGARINVVQVSAGRHHNVALASTGLVYTWGLGADQLGLGVGGGGEEGGGGGVTHTTCPRVVQGMGQDRGVFVSASAGHTCVVSETGDLYSWGSTDGQQGILGHGQGSWQPVPKRVVGLKRGIKVAAGPEHTVVLLSASSPALPHPHADLKEVQARLAAAVSGRANDEDEEEDEGESRSPSPFSVGSSSEGDGDLFAIDDVKALMPLFHGGGHDKKKSNKGGLASSLPALIVLPTLKELCERAIAAQVDMRNAISVLAHAEALDSRELAGYCVEFVQRNLDGILVAGRPADLDFLLEDAADDVNTLFQEASSSSSSSAAAAAAAAAEEAAAAAAAARPSPVTTMLARVQRGQDPTLEEALRLERGLKKRLTQVEELARLEAGGTVLTVDQVRKMSRRSILESEAEKLLPLLARLRVIDKAREVREKEKERASAAAEAAAAAIAGEGEKDGDLKHDQLKSTEEKAFSLLPSLSSSFSSSLLLPTTYTCDACHVTCANEGIWQDHLKGKRHSKRLAKVQAEAAVIQAALEQATKEAREKDMWQRGVPLPPPPTPSSPWSAASVAPSTPTSSMGPSPMSEHRHPLSTTPSSLSFSPPNSNKKSFREILEEEERRSATAAAAAAAAAAGKGGRARGMSMSGNSSNSSSSSSPFGKSPGLAVGSPPGHARRSNSISSSSSSNSSTPLQPLSSSVGTGTGGGGEGTVLLSAFLKTTPAAPRPVVPALSSTSSWAANGSGNGGGSGSKTGSSSSSSSSKQAASVGAVVSSVSAGASLDLPSSPPAVRSGGGGAAAAAGGGGGATPSFEAIMAEEERKAALVRFDGNTCPWLSGRRERSDSFEVIQKQQRELESLKEEEESRAMAEALAVAAAEEEKERQEEEDRWFRKQIQQQQQQQRRRSASMTSPSSSSKPSSSSSSSSSKKKKKPQQGGPTTTEATAGTVPVVEGEGLQTPKKKNYNAGGGDGGSGSRGGKPRQPQSSSASSSRDGNGGGRNTTGDKGAAAGSSEKKRRGAPFRPATASPAATATTATPPPPQPNV